MSDGGQQKLKLKNMYSKNIFDLFDEAFFGTARTRTTATVDGKTYEMALPGFSKEDISVEVEGNVLTISAEIEEKEETKWRHSFSKRFELPSSVDAEQVEAKMENGVLSLKFGKSKEAKKVSIL